MTGIVTELVFVKDSLMIPVPELAGFEIPVITALVQLKVVLANADVGTYPNVSSLQIDGGVSVLVNVGCGSTVIAIAVEDAPNPQELFP